MVHYLLGVQLSEFPVEELELHFHYCIVTRGPRVRTNERERLLNAYFVAKGVKSSCTMLEVVSLDWRSFRAHSLIPSIPSFRPVRAVNDRPILSTYRCSQRIHRTRRTV